MEAILNSYYSNNAKKLHNMVDKIIFKLKFDVDNDDFYSLANEIFYDCIKRYDGKQDFDGFLYSCLINKFKTEMTRRNRQKRQADRMSISIDSPIGDDENATIGDFLVDKNTVEREIFEDGDECFSEVMTRYLSRLSFLQREVLNLMSIGFNPDEICKELHINRKQYNDCYDAIHAYRNTSILM